MANKANIKTNKRAKSAKCSLPLFYKIIAASNNLGRQTKTFPGRFYTAWLGIKILRASSFIWGTKCSALNTLSKHVASINACLT